VVHYEIPLEAVDERCNCWGCRLGVRVENEDHIAEGMDPEKQASWQQKCDLSVLKTKQKKEAELKV